MDSQIQTSQNLATLQLFYIEMDSFAYVCGLAKWYMEVELSIESLTNFIVKSMHEWKCLQCFHVIFIPLFFPKKCHFYSCYQKKTLCYDLTKIKMFHKWWTCNDETTYKLAKMVIRL